MNPQKHIIILPEDQPYRKIFCEWVTYMSAKRKKYEYGKLDFLPWKGKLTGTTELYLFPLLTLSQVWLLPLFIRQFFCTGWALGAETDKSTRVERLLFLFLHLNEVQLVVYSSSESLSYLYLRIYFIFFFRDIYVGNLVNT